MPDDIQTRTTRERRRLNKMLRDGGVEDRMVRALRPVVENTAWMKVKLDAAREKIHNTDIVIPYDNGGGQKGIRESPAFHGYESLWKSYMLGMGRLLDTMPEREQADAEKDRANESAPATVLDLVMARRRANG